MERTQNEKFESDNFLYRRLFIFPIFKVALSSWQKYNDVKDLSSLMEKKLLEKLNKVQQNNFFRYVKFVWENSSAGAQNGGLQNCLRIAKVEGFRV